MVDTRSILVVCTGNICRSPMAEGFLKAGLNSAQGDAVHISSAGTHALHGHPAHAHAISAMKSYGVDINAHRARLLNRELVQAADMILVMEAMHAHFIKRLFLFRRPALHQLGAFGPEEGPYDIPDPIGGDLEAYLKTAAIINRCLKGVIAFIENTS